MFDALEDVRMRTTVVLDDELLAKAQELSGIKEKSTLLRRALEELIHREASRRAALLGGIAPDFKAPPRRRFPPE